MNCLYRHYKSMRALFLLGVTKIFSPERNTRPRKKNVADSLQLDWLKIGNDFRKVMDSYDG